MYNRPWGRDHISCDGGIQAHHLLKPFKGYRGWALKSSDENAVPLCYALHAQLHDIIGAEDKFWQYYNQNADYGRLLAQRLWFISPENSDV